MVAVTLAAVGVSGESSASAAGPAGSWQVERTYAPTPGGLSAISCATTIDCMAVESGEVVVTTNGGTNWTTENAPAGMGQINAISCPSATTCMVVGYGAPINLPVLAATTNGGMSWTNQNLPPGVIQVLGISCPSTTTCSAVGAWTGAAAPSAEEDAAVITTTNGGANWTSESIPADSEELNGISCPSTTTCVAVGTVPYPPSECPPFPFSCPVSLDYSMSTTNGGTTWSGESGSSPGFAEGDSFQGVSCPSTSECMAVGGTNGIGEQRGIAEGILLSGTCTLVTGCGSLSFLSMSVVTSVSCFSASTCTAVGAPLTGFVGQIATAGVTGWTTQNAPLGAVSGVTCPSASECMVSGGVAEDGQPGAVAETTNGGANWAAVFSFPYAVSNLFAVSCPSPSVCTTVGGTTGPGESSGDFGPGEGPGVVLNSTDGGAEWTPQALPAGTGPLSAVSCASTSVCEALGSDPYVGAPFIVGTTDGGATWQSQTAPSGIQYLTQLSCPSTSACTGIGETPAGPVIIGTADGGATWTTETAPPGLTYLYSIACPSVTECTAVGETNVSSPTPNAAIVVTINGGSTWTTETPPSGVYTLTSVACSTVLNCIAIAGPLRFISTSDGGATWTITGSISSSQVASANDIACTSATICTVVATANDDSGSGLALTTTDGGSTWTTESTPTAIAYSGISCPAMGACTAVGQTSASALGGAIIIGQAPFTSILTPSNGTALRGTSAVLDASASAAAGVATVQFAITGGPYTQSVIGTAVPTLYGYIFEWNTTGVPGGTYTLQSLVTDEDGNTAYSPGITITVDNTPPTTAVLIPSNGAAVRGTSALLDATASASYGVDIASVQFVLTGGAFNRSVIGTAIPTLYGYLYGWNTTSVPGGTYTLQSLATDAAGNTAYSPGITITVDNTPPTTAVLIPSNGATLRGPRAVLDAQASASFGVKIAAVQFVLSGGSYNKTVIGTATRTFIGWVLVWNMTSVSSGTYTLQSLATDAAGNAAYSPGKTIKLTN